MANPHPTRETSVQPKQPDAPTAQPTVPTPPPVQVATGPSFLRRNWKFIAALTVSVFVAAASIAFPLPLIYSATAYLAANLPSFVSAAYASITASALVIATLASVAGLLTRGLLAAAGYLTKKLSNSATVTAVNAKSLSDDANALNANAAATTAGPANPPAGPPASPTNFQSPLPPAPKSPRTEGSPSPAVPPAESVPAGTTPTALKA